MTDLQIAIYNARKTNKIFTLVNAMQRSGRVTYFIDSANSKAVIKGFDGDLELVTLQEARKSYSENKKGRWIEQWQGEGYNRFRIDK